MSTNMNINGIDINLTNEMIQRVNRDLNITFTSSNTIDEIKTAFETNNDPIVYETDSYEGYTKLIKLHMDINEFDRCIYSVTLQYPEVKIEDAVETTSAINFAIKNMSNEEALQCISIFPRWESYIDKKMEANTRFRYNDNLWISRTNINVVLENQYPGIDTAALYMRIDKDHAGTLEDPIPYDQNLEVFENKYYIENEVKYKCTRNSGQPLYASCSSLVGIYFELV